MQHSTHTVIWSKIAQREEKFQYGGRLFHQTGSNNISAVDCNTSTKFGLQINSDPTSAASCLIGMKFDTPLQNNMLVPVTGSTSNPEVVFQYDERWFLQSGISYILAVD